MLADSNVMIAGGFGPLRGQIIRIGHMGQGARPDAVLPTVQALEHALAKQGIAVKQGAAKAAAQAEL